MTTLSQPRFSPAFYPACVTVKMAAKENGKKEIGSIEVYFAKKLANNDKKIRDRALKRMRVWLSSRTGDAFTDMEVMKLWKGLFYCMWFSDKPLVQEELAKSLADLIHGLKDSVAAGKFTEGFFQTMGREWYGIDALRMNKFYMFIRKFLREVLQYLKNQNWNFEALDCVGNALMKGPCSVSNDKYPKGVCMFVIEITVEELGKVCYDGYPEKNVISRIIDPFLALSAQAEDNLVFKAVKENILSKILPGSEEKIDGLSVDCFKMADRLFEEAGKKEVSTKRRKLLFGYSDMFRKQGELEKCALEAVDGGTNDDAEVTKKKKNKKRKSKSKDKPSEKKMKVQKSSENLDSSEVDLTELEKVDTPSSDSMAQKLDFDTSYALNKEASVKSANEKDCKKKQKKSRKSKGTEDIEGANKMEGSKKKEGSKKNEDSAKKRKRKSSVKVGDEVVEKLPKKEKEQNESQAEQDDGESLIKNLTEGEVLVDLREAKKNVDDFKRKVRKGNRMNMIEQGSEDVGIDLMENQAVQERGKDAEKEIKGSDIAEIPDSNSQNKSETDKKHHKDETGACSKDFPILTETKKKSSVAQDQAKINMDTVTDAKTDANEAINPESAQATGASYSVKKPTRRERLDRKAKKQTNATNNAKIETIPSASPSPATELPSSVDQPSSDNIPSREESQPAEIKLPVSSKKGRKSKKITENLDSSASKKKVIFELSKNAVTSISNLKINPAAVFTPEQRPTRSVLKKRRRASDFF